MQDSLFYNIVDIVSIYSGVDSEEIMTPKKSRPVTKAKRLASNILKQYGYGATEISLILNIDRKSVYDYVQTHEDWMDNSSYKKSYLSCISALDELDESGLNLKSEVDKLKIKVLKLEDMYEHNKQLILS